MPSVDGGDGGVRLSGAPHFLEIDAAHHDSDVSSIISLPNTLRLSDTEEEWDEHSVEGNDTRKYRLPDVGKTRLDLHSKQPFDEPVRPPPDQNYPPSTPRTYRTWQSTGYGFPPSAGSIDNVVAGESDFVVPTLSRSNSVYTLGRATLQGQLSQLTSLTLPDASSLAKRISGIPTSSEAAKALSDASEQIRLWINKASDVLAGLNADDDIEWAAAGGSEGIEDVERAIRRFSGLVEVYLTSIDGLQTRADASTLSAADLTNSVKQMESIVGSWNAIKTTLNGVKEQVEVALDWEELWNSVLGEVGQEMAGLNRLVFEMEEKRHQGADNVLTSKDSIDLGELETIIEERPGQGMLPDSSRFAASHLSVTSPLQSPGQDGAVKEDSSLLALFARMQPLRAALDFLPMKLSAFHSRAKTLFPSACADLDQRREQLESQWTKLESDAEFLRRELGEDRWILVFRNAGRQALKMCESITRSYIKLRDGVHTVENVVNASAFIGKVESYQAKKVHYGPAIARVLAIIDRGVKERLTLNGEILRLQSDMRERWTTLQADMKDLDTLLEEIVIDHRDHQQMRDSVSTVLSSERSTASSMLDTPGSSPASSVVGLSRSGSFQGSRTPTPLANSKARPSSLSRGRAHRPSLVSSIPRRIPLTNSSPFYRSTSPSPLGPRSSYGASVAGDPPSSSRPRWSRSTRVETHEFLPFSALEPSPYAKSPIEKRTNFLRSTRAVSQPVTPASKTRPTSMITASSGDPRTPVSVPASSRMSLPPKTTSSTTTTPTSQQHKSYLPVPSFSPPSASKQPQSLLRQRSRSNLRASSATLRPTAAAVATTSLRSVSTTSTSNNPARGRTHTTASQSSEATNTEILPHQQRRLSRAQISINLREREKERVKVKDERPPWRP